MRRWEKKRKKEGVRDVGQWQGGERGEDKGEGRSNRKSKKDYITTVKFLRSS